MKQGNFIARNEGFTCDACGFAVPPAKGTFRNHCPNCLTSKHVDLHVPGDRANTCCGLMPATAIEGTNPDTLDIVHRCETCGQARRNKTASDDSKDKLFDLMASR